MSGLIRFLADVFGVGFDPETGLIEVEAHGVFLIGFSVGVIGAMAALAGAIR